MLNRSRASRSPSSCSRPWSRCHQRAPTTRAGQQVGTGGRGVRQRDVADAGLGTDDGVLPGRDARASAAGPGRGAARRGGRPPSWPAPRSLLTSDMAPSCSMPVGCPSSSRSIRPSTGSGVLASTPASSRAREFTHAPWWSRLIRKTGRSGTSASRKPRSGVAAGKALHRPAAAGDPGPIRLSRNVARDPARYSSGVIAPLRSQVPSSTPPWTGWAWASWKPGTSSRPERSTTSVAGTDQVTDLVATDRDDPLADDCDGRDLARHSAPCGGQARR